MKVLVTGANGHLGFNVCKAFLDSGHDVRASIRSLDDRAKADPLREIGVTDLVGLNVREFDPFVDACRGIDVLLHVAATYAMRPDGEAAVAALIGDSVEGAENAIRAAAAAGVSKVVLTSSVATLPRVPHDAPATTEADWASDLAVPYFRAKVEGERAAWKVAEETGVRLTTILPGTIGGPGFLRTTPSIDIIENIMRGSLRFGAPNMNVPYIDVRDVAAAHLLAATRDVSGRFIVVNDHVPTLREVSLLMNGIDPDVRAAPVLIPDVLLEAGPALDWVRAKIFGGARLVTREVVATMRGKITKVSTARAKAELGWQQGISIGQSLAETMAAIRTLRHSHRHHPQRRRHIG
jgi:dihydroflavonol-4-reductase